MKKILVIGATGMLGKPVALQFLQDGFDVRIFTRDREKAKAKFGDSMEVVQGSVQEPATLEQAIKDCEGVHINLRGGNTAEDLDRIEHRGTAAIAQISARLGVKRLSFLSYAAHLEKYPDSPYARAKLQGETAIRNSGVPYSIFRASHFMEGLDKYIKGNRAYIIGKHPPPVHWCAAKNYAQMVSMAFKLPEAQNKTFYILGPQALTLDQAIKIYCAQKRPGTTISTMPISLMLWMGRISFNNEMKFFAELMRFFEQAGDQGDPTEANQLLGGPQITLEEWCRQN